ncbi:carboxypeptidase-like regulatory domain-containing protein [Winogradskyella tangerina]|uniref:carboxypeptidase-like regulatory domain-containing protein n=1 Tax=Winogradskyella tangerina TaxID=2023240 RepID=UPI000DBE088E|nr:carboxypeptidase-like regulatory domain-containing protein [Winogradskyella tangerina]
MKKSLYIEIPEPCHEDWSKMTLEEQGRHCTKCQTTVVDFTNKSDEEIVNILANGAHHCGRFKADQLNRQLTLERKDKNNYLSWVASGLFAFLTFGNQDVYAQGTPKTVKVDTLQTPTVKGKKAISLVNEQLVTGTVSTASDGLPLPGANVFVKGTNRGASTDFDGKFTIRTQVGETLIFSYVGFLDKEIKVDTTLKYHVELEVDPTLEDVVVGGLISYSCRPDGSRYERSDGYFKVNIQRKKWLERNKAFRQRVRAERKAKREAIRNGQRERTAVGKFFYGIKRLFSKK